MEVILDNKSHYGKSFIGILADGRFKVGQSEQHADIYADAQQAYDHYRPYAAEGMHWAWNICYMLEDYLKGQEGVTT